MKNILVLFIEEKAKISSWERKLQIIHFFPIVRIRIVENCYCGYIYGKRYIYNDSIFISL